MPASVPDSLEEYLSSLNEFKSHDRTESLYSDYSSARQSNPAGFHSNNATWQMILTDVLKYGLQPGAAQSQSQSQSQTDRLVLHLNDQLIESLRRPGVGKPYGLACPLWSLSSLSKPSSSAVLAPLNSFISSGGWGPSHGIAFSMVRSLSWASRALTRGTILDPDQRFDQLELDQKLSLVKIDWVNLLLLRHAADRIIERYQQDFLGLSPSMECLFTHAQFEDQLAREIFPSAQSGLKLSSTDLGVLLKHLERDRRILTAEKNLIKFVVPAAIETAADGTKFSSVGPPAISEVDRGVLSVKQTLQQLTQQTQTLSAQIDQRTQDAKQCIKNSQPEFAATHLKARKALKLVLTQRLGVLETLNGVYMKIEQASTDVEIMKAYESSAATLKSLLAAPTLAAGRVAQTMDQLADVLADQHEIDAAINQPLPHDAAAEIDEQEIAAELARLVDAQDEPAQSKRDPLPSSATTTTTSIDHLQEQLARLKVPDHPPQTGPAQSSEEHQPRENHPLTS
ncbi:hypothetical protein PCASD_12043 [Puccinia coronata f. sp. avenae]|uniref:Charged multivesicular body protein 7 n=1 Tax=Puccinia coronata f. sp. avenae TaxID=200324 RepID=A0A2N5TDG3_9BASI|nr:hypothetical protein PCASD_12043 [Puccinia coronata f. sp. avenae]